MSTITRSTQYLSEKQKIESVLIDTEKNQIEESTHLQIHLDSYNVEILIHKRDKNNNIHPNVNYLHLSFNELKLLHSLLGELVSLIPGTKPENQNNEEREEPEIEPICV